jgi:2-keto-myo-inositol isomerase
MKYAMNHATLMKTPLEEFLKAIAEAGFHGVELRRDETFNYLQSHSIDDLNQLFHSLNLECVSFNAIELFSLCSEKEFQNILTYTEKLMKIGIQIGCDLIIAVPSFLDDIHMKNEEIREKTIARLKILGKMANEYNFRLAFEPLGFPNCSVRKLDFALDIIKNEYLPKMGLVIDTFHFFIAEHNINDLDLLDSEDLWLVHINDAIQ